MIEHACGRAAIETTLVANVAIRGRQNVVTVTHECRCHEYKHGEIRMDITASGADILRSAMVASGMYE